MKYIKQIFFLFFAFNLLCIASLTTYAHEVPDGNRRGTVTVEMEYDSKAVTGGTLTAYRVGQIQEYDGNYSFAKTDVMASFTGSYDDIGSAALAENLAAFVKENQLSAYDTAKNQKGKAVFTNLELGLYLIVQTEASEGYEPLKPFLVSVPMNENGHYVYEINAEGKFQLHQEPKPTTPPKPSGSKPATPSKPSKSLLPQTGQLNWPIPVLVVLGLCLFSFGWILRFGREKGSYEK